MNAENKPPGRLATPPSPSGSHSVTQAPPLSPTTSTSHNPTPVKADLADPTGPAGPAGPTDPLSAAEWEEAVARMQRPNSPLLAGMDPVASDPRFWQLEDVHPDPPTVDTAVFLHDLQQVDHTPLREPELRFRDRYEARQRTIRKADAAVGRPATPVTPVLPAPAPNDHLRQESLPGEPPA